MAKIYLKYGSPLEDVDEQEALEIRKKFLEAQKSGENLALIQKSVNHRDGNFLLTFNLIQGFNNDKDVYRQRYTFTSEDGIKKFHEKYGNIKASIVEGYGLVDRNTQFLIDSKQCVLEDMGTYKVLRSNSNMEQETKQKLNDLWREYNEEHHRKFN